MIIDFKRRLVNISFLYSSSPDGFDLCICQVIILNNLIVQWNLIMTQDCYNFTGFSTKSVPDWYDSPDNTILLEPNFVLSWDPLYWGRFSNRVILGTVLIEIMLTWDSMYIFFYEYSMKISLKHKDMNWYYHFYRSIFQINEEYKISPTWISIFYHV